MNPEAAKPFPLLYGPKNGVSGEVLEIGRLRLPDRRKCRGSVHIQPNGCLTPEILVVPDSELATSDADFLVEFQPPRRIDWCRIYPLFAS